MATYEFFDNARNNCNDEKVEVITKAKELYELSTGFNPDPNKFFRTIRSTLNCMFPISLPYIGTNLLEDEV
jgi:hypothetical protein